MKRILAMSCMAMLLAIATLALPALHADEAHAAALTDTTHCASLGSLIETDPLTVGSQTYGYLNIYYNSSNGYNCAETTSSSIDDGHSKFMFVEIEACTQTSPSSNCTAISSSKPYEDSDSGNYSYYAGPAGVYAKGHCIEAAAEISWNGELPTLNTGGASHCG